MKYRTIRISRLKAILFKEVLEILRDRIVLFSMIIIPLTQIFVSGVILNTDPKHLATVLYNESPNIFTRDIIVGLQNTQYFNFKYQAKSEAEANKLLANGKAKIAIFIPHDFYRELILGKHPQILLKADATQPLVVSKAEEAAVSLVHNVLDKDLQGLANVNTSENKNPFDLIVYNQYNPESISQFFTVPGVIGITFSLSMLLMTLISIITEKTTGTIEGLLVTPTRPVEIILGKITPFFIIGSGQFAIAIMMARWYFGLPMAGSVILLFICVCPFIVSCLSLGLFISSIAKTQFQAVQIANIYFIPNFLFSGFAFPFQGMPIWAQWIGNCLPLTHLVRILHGIILKGNNFIEISNSFFSLSAFMIVVLIAAILSYKQTLDW
jgi:ABC-2 type transport system permease protein